MNIFLFKAQIIIMLLFFSCNNENKSLIDITNQCFIQDNFLTSCFLGINEISLNEIVITNDSDYKNLEESLRINPVNINCDTASLKQVDFTKYSLVGKRTSGAGCSADYIRKVFIDESNETIVYNISIEYIGDCEKLITSYNWALIPRIPENYSVKFNTTYN